MNEDLPDVGSRWKAWGVEYEVTQVARSAYIPHGWQVILCEGDLDGRAWVCPLDRFCVDFTLVEEEDSLAER